MEIFLYSDSNFTTNCEKVIIGLDDSWTLNRWQAITRTNQLKYMIKQYIDPYMH